MGEEVEMKRCDIETNLEIMEQNRQALEKSILMRTGKDQSPEGQITAMAELVGDFEELKQDFDGLDKAFEDATEKLNLHKEYTDKDTTATLNAVRERNVEIERDRETCKKTIVDLQHLSQTQHKITRCFNGDSTFCDRIYCLFIILLIAVLLLVMEVRAIVKVVAPEGGGGGGAGSSTPSPSP